MQELDPDRQGAEFKKMFQAGITPGYLIDKNPHNIYSAIAAPFHPGGHRDVSYTMALKAMGGHEDKSKKARQAKAKAVDKQRSMNRKQFEETMATNTARRATVQGVEGTLRKKDDTARGKSIAVVEVKKEAQSETKV